MNDRNGKPLIFTATIQDVEQATEAEGARLKKYPPLAGAPDGNSHPNDFVFFRLAEMYLIRAEALNETGDQTRRDRGPQHRARAALQSRRSRSPVGLPRRRFATRSSTSACSSWRAKPSGVRT